MKYAQYTLTEVGTILNKFQSRLIVVKTATDQYAVDIKRQKLKSCETRRSDDTTPSLHATDLFEPLVEALTSVHALAQLHIPEFSLLCRRGISSSNNVPAVATVT